MNHDELAEIRAAFAIEASEMLTEMEEALLALQTVPAIGDDFNRLFRAVHTIKGSSSIVGAEYIEQFCHDVEHLLVRIREQELSLSNDLIALFLQCHDHITALVDNYANAAGALPPPARHAQLLGIIAAWHETPEPDAVAEPEPQELELLLSEEATTDLPAAVQQIVRVDANKLDQLINLVVELVTASSALESHLKQQGDATAIESASGVSTLVKLIQERAMLFRMVPVGDLFKRFHRLLHDLSASNGKQIKLKVAGGETELDKVMAEKIREPLVHLIRNAADHGIELPDERRAAGKPPFGTIRLNAYQEAGNIVVEVADDGRGIDRGRVLRKALERGLIRPSEVSERDALALIFEPGFSTLEEATLLSGRGVGMDAVKRAVEELRGSVDITSSEGLGTTIKVRLPLSLALIDGFMVAVGQEYYILPMDLVAETIDLPPESQRELRRRGYLDLRGQALPCLDLRTILKSDGTAPESRFAVVVQGAQGPVGLAVDQLMGEVKAVIKPLGRLYHQVRIISGATILGDGTLALILDVPELLGSAE